MNKSLDKKSFNYAEHDNIKIGVLSDTHCHINSSVLKHLSDCDVILHAGDIGSIEVIKQLNEISGNVVSVCGNNDNAGQWTPTEHHDLQQIPQIAEVELPGGIIAITHGDEHYSDYETWHEKLRTNFPMAKAVVYGHSHRLVCDQDADPWILNPGPAGETRIQKHGVSCLLITANKVEWKVSEFRA
ncbi:MAG: metallophosphoesterase family protein [Gammaproteobacteria bacterium]|nr:metallophosphoesterase family protein [Gammaproteobacteria bacterium]